MNRSPVVLLAPHFQEYCLLLANALSHKAPVTLFIDRERLENEYAGRELYVAQGVTLRHTRFDSILDPLHILGALFRQRGAILHIQEASGLIKTVLFAITITLARLFRPCVLTVHDPLPHGGRDMAIAQRIGRFRHYVRRAAHLVLVHGDHCRHAYIQSEGEWNQSIALVHHGVILGGVPKDRAVDQPFSMFHFGRMEAYKGLDVLLTAVEGLAYEGVEFRLKIAGSGPELDRLAERFGKIPGVSIDNRFMPAAELIDQMAQADCLVLPYRSATQSGVLAAAFANGRFVIASDVGGIPDVVDHMESGLLVPPGDAVALADAIRMAAQSPDLRERLRRGALQAAASRLDWNEIAQNTRAAYQAIAAARGSQAQPAEGRSQDIMAPGSSASVRGSWKATAMPEHVVASRTSDEGDRPLVTIGIKALNERAHIEECLAAACAVAEELGGEVILADSGSTDGTIEIARRFPVRILQLANTTERSCGTGAQLAFQQARGRYFYMLDGDMVLDRGFIGAGIAYLEDHPEVAGVGGIVNERNVSNEEFQIRFEAVSHERGWMPGIVDRLDCGGLYRTDVVRSVGYFADRNLHAFEEFELGARLGAAGWALARIDHRGVDHYGHLTGGYRLLKRRFLSGYSGAPGEVLRAALGRSHLPFVLRRFNHVRFDLAVISWWLLIIAGLFVPPHGLVSLGLILVALAFLIVRRRSLRLGVYSLVAWNVSALGSLFGVLRTRKDPLLTIEAVELSTHTPATGRAAPRLAREDAPLA